MICDLLGLISIQSPDRRIEQNRKEKKSWLIGSESRVRTSLAASKPPSGGTAPRFSASKYLPTSFQLLAGASSQGRTAPSTDSDKAAGCRSNSVQEQPYHILGRNANFDGCRLSLNAPAKLEKKMKKKVTYSWPNGSITALYTLR